jgi:hypothetical protein
MGYFFFTLTAGLCVGFGGLLRARTGDARWLWLTGVGACAICAEFAWLLSRAQL